MSLEGMWLFQANTKQNLKNAGTAEDRARKWEIKITALFCTEKPFVL